MDGSSHRGAASWLSSAPLPSFLQRIPRAKLHHPLAAFFGLSSDETTKQCFAWTQDRHAPKSLMLSLLILSESGMILVKQLSYSSFWVDFGQPDHSTWLSNATVESSKYSWAPLLFSPPSWLESTAFMFYGFPRANLKWQDDAGRNRKPVHRTFSRHQKVTSPSPLPIGALSYSLLLGPAHRLLAQRQENKTSELRISLPKVHIIHLSKAKQETNEKLKMHQRQLCIGQ